MVVNEPIALAYRHLIKLAVFEMGCVENESPAILRIAEDRFGSGDHLLVED